jgi:hypothetical protein
MRKDHIKIVGSKSHKTYYLVPTDNESYRLYSQDGTTSGYNLVSFHIPNRGHLSVFCDGEYLLEEEPYTSLAEIEDVFESYFQEDPSFIVSDDSENDEDFDCNDTNDHQKEQLKEPWESDSEYDDSDPVEYFDDSDENDNRKRHRISGNK